MHFAVNKCIYNRWYGLETAIRMHTVLAANKNNLTIPIKKNDGKSEHKQK